VDTGLGRSGVRPGQVVSPRRWGFRPGPHIRNAFDSVGVGPGLSYAKCHAALVASAAHIVEFYALSRPVHPWAGPVFALPDSPCMRQVTFVRRRHRHFRYMLLVARHPSGITAFPFTPTGRPRDFSRTLTCSESFRGLPDVVGSYLALVWVTVFPWVFVPLWVPVFLLCESRPRSLCVLAGLVSLALDGTIPVLPVATDVAVCGAPILSRYCRRLFLSTIWVLYFDRHPTGTSAWVRPVSRYGLVGGALLISIPILLTRWGRQGCLPSAPF